jgi:hypothetical protein
MVITTFVKIRKIRVPFCKIGHEFYEFSRRVITAFVKIRKIRVPFCKLVIHLIKNVYNQFKITQ